MSAIDDDDREIAQLVRNCWNPATGVHVYGGVLAKLSELCARSFVAADGLDVTGPELLRSRGWRAQAAIPTETGDEYDFWQHSSRPGENCDYQTAVVTEALRMFEEAGQRWALGEPVKARCSMSTFCTDYRHNCLVVYRRRWRDLWRKTYWVVCIYCGDEQGPNLERDAARGVADAYNCHDSLPVRP